MKMNNEKDKAQMLNMLDLMLDEERPYHERLEAYEYLLEDCEEIVDDMLKRSYSLEGDTGKMLMEVLAQYKGNKAIFMGLVSYLYKGEDVALFAHLIGSYGDEKGIEVLKNFCDEYEPNYNEYMEIRNAVEELGGDFDMKQDFTDDPLYRYLKGLDETDDRKSPFEDMLNPEAEDDEDRDDECECGLSHGDEHCDESCECHHHNCDNAYDNCDNDGNFYDNCDRNGHSHNSHCHCGDNSEG